MMVTSMEIRSVHRIRPKTSMTSHPADAKVVDPAKTCAPHRVPVVVNVCSQVREYLVRLGVENTDANARLLCTARAIVETSGLQMDYKAALCAGKLSAQEFDNMFKNLPKAMVMHIRLRSKQLLYGLSTEDLMATLSDEDIYSLLLG